MRTESLLMGSANPTSDNPRHLIPPRFGPSRMTNSIQIETPVPEERGFFFFPIPIRRRVGLFRR